MDTNILVALRNFIIHPTAPIVNHYASAIRVNAVGDALELYIKDLFCGSYDVTNPAEKSTIHSRYFSYFGNQNNPPDGVLMRGDAYEVKKIGTLENDLALNSSYPKHKLYSDDSRIKRECRLCDGGSWTEKNFVYIVGTVARNTLKSLWFVYGDCYAASLEHYAHIAAQITDSITGSGIELGATTELARVNRVDPLGITNLRVRGMWSIQHPARVFAYILNRNHRSVSISMTAIMRAEKYLSFNEQHRADLEALRDNITVFIDDVHIKDPNNPANMIDAKMIQFLSS